MRLQKFRQVQGNLTRTLQRSWVQVGLPQNAPSLQLVRESSSRLCRQPRHDGCWSW